MNKILQSEVRIRLNDCDPYGHLYNGKFIDYFMNAREDQVRQFYDFDLYDYTLKTGKGWVVSTNQLSYFKPAGMNELVCITSSLRSLSEKQLKLELVMYNLEETHIKAIHWVTFTHYDLAKKTAAIHDEKFMKLFKPLETNHQGTFEDRVNEILIQIKNEKSSIKNTH